MIMEKFSDDAVKQIFDSYPMGIKQQLLQVRQLTFDTHRELFPNEDIVENLKWQQPTYTARTGTPIRIAPFDELHGAIFVHCQTTLIEQFREMFTDTLTFSKNRAILLDSTQTLAVNELKLCIQMALTYHQKS